MRSRIAEILNIKTDDVGVTATSGEGLTSFGQGKGIQAFVSVTAMG
jgi:2-C-methyl-D-erythritol 2,4-cyclodiphosphate synthase